MTDVEKIKANLKRDLESLRATREELRLQLSLAKADAKSEWDRLERRFELAEEEWTRIHDHSKTTLSEIESRMCTLVEEVKRGYHALRRTLDA